MNSTYMQPNRRHLLAGAAATAATVAAPAILRAQGGPLRVLRPASARTASAAPISRPAFSSRSACRT